MKSRWLLSILFPVLACSSCAAEPVDDEGEGETSDELRSAVNCKETAVTGYRSGSPYAMSVITVGGKATARTTAHAFLKMQIAAEKAGVTLSISSGFRSMKEQQYFYNCYLTKKCNNGNLAAKPGNSPHQNGSALDLAASDFSWLVKNASKFGFKKTVPSERWHYQYSGPDVGGPCSGGAAPNAPATNDPDDNDEGDTTTPPRTPATPPAGPGTDPNADGDGNVPVPPARPADLGGAGCYSPTMAKQMEEKSCVQSSADDVMYQCHEGLWYRGVTNGTGRYGACTSVHAL
jgi:hypothetical protein